MTTNIASTKVKRDSWGGSRLNNLPVSLPLPIFYAGETVLVLGKIEGQQYRQLMVCKLSPNRPYVQLIEDTELEPTESELDWETYSTDELITKYVIKGIDSRKIDTVINAWSEHSSPAEVRQSLDYVSDIITSYIRGVTGEKIAYAPHTRHGSDYSTDEIKSAQLSKYESYPVLDPNSDNYIIDCRQIKTIPDLINYLKPVFTIGKDSLAADLLKKTSYHFLKDNKILASENINFYFTYAEHILEDEPNIKDSLSRLLASLLECSENWPSDLPFYQRESINPKFRSFFYYVEETESVKLLNSILEEYGIIALKRDDFLGYGKIYG